MKKTNLIYWISTGLLSTLYLISVVMYFANNNHVAEEFTNMGFPTYIIYPLAFLKLAGVIVLLTQKKSAIKEWAYSAFFFNILLAFTGHIMVNDGEHWGAVVAMILLLISYSSGKQKFNYLR